MGKCCGEPSLSQGAKREGEVLRGTASEPRGKERWGASRGHFLVVVQLIKARTKICCTTSRKCLSMLQNPGSVEMPYIHLPSLLRSPLLLLFVHDVALCYCDSPSRPRVGRLRRRWRSRWRRGAHLDIVIYKMSNFIHFSVMFL